MPSLCEENKLLRLAGYGALMTVYVYHFHTATPDTPTITMPPPVVTTPPPSDPLEVYFANNTPHVVGDTVTVQVHTNKPASATCRLGQVATMLCKQFLCFHVHRHHCQGFFQEGRGLGLASPYFDTLRSIIPGLSFCNFGLCWEGSRCARYFVAIMKCSLYTGSPGSTTVFQNVPSDFYYLRVTATSGSEEKEVTWKVYVPETSAVCSVNLINTGLVVNGSTVSLEFRGMGPTSRFTCRLDSRQFHSCELYCIAS